MSAVKGARKGGYGSWQGRCAAASAPILLLVANLFLFAPVAIYLGNVEEYDLGLGTILVGAAPVALALALGLAAASALVPARWFPAWRAAILAVGVLTWIQSTLLSTSYGMLDGRGLDFAPHEWRTWHESILWIGGLAACVRFAGRIDKHITFVAGALVVLQLLGCSLMYAKRPVQLFGTSQRARSTESHIFSTGTNVIHILLDEFQSDVFADLLRESPDLARRLDGFVFFEQDVGSFTSTLLAVPALLSGQMYGNDIPIQQFIAESLERKALHNVLARNGYKTDLVSFMPRQCRGSFSSCQRIAQPFMSGSSSRAIAVEMLDLSLFRSFPHPLKKLIYRNQHWFVRALYSRTEPALRFAASNSVAFFEEFGQRIALGDATPRYKLIHLAVPHSPFVYDENCGFAGPLEYNRFNYMNQARCGLTSTLRFLERLEALGVYDRSMIVISSDHGSNFAPPGLEHRGALDPKVVSRALALLAVKRPGERHPLTISTAPSSMTDLPATIASIIGIDHPFPGTSVFALVEGEARTREYRHYEWNQKLWNSDFLPRMDTYQVHGDPRLAGSWTAAGSVFAPGAEEAP
jgi:hypothetical protein